MSKKHFNLADLIEMVSDAVPADREAVVCGDRRFTYRQLDRQANRLAHYLRSRGVGAADHVGLYMYNCGQYLESLLACFKIRAVPININYRYVGDELAYVIGNADMVALIHGLEFSGRIVEVRARCPRLRFTVAVEDGSGADASALDSAPYDEAVAGQSAERDFGERSDDDLFILYTGGTTGMPKGVMWPHKAVFYGGLGGAGFYHPDGPIQEPEQIVQRSRENVPIVSMPLAPLMHGAALWGACSSLIVGNTVALNANHSLDGEQVWDIAEREGVCSVMLVGDAIAIPLLDALRANPGRWQLPNLINIGSGGAVFSESVQNGFRELFPNLIVSNSFGSTETGAQGQHNGVSSDGLGRIERAEHADVVIPEEGRCVQPGSGERGFLARSGHIPIGYYNDPERTAKSFVTVEGKRWVMTGDISTVDADGTIIVYGRGSNCINSGGEKIFPEEVEQAIKTHPAVFDTLVIGVPDERFGERVAAVVHARDAAALTLDSLQTACREHVAGYKVPRELYLSDHIGREPNGKPNYKWARGYADAHEPDDAEAR